RTAKQLASAEDLGPPHAVCDLHRLDARLDAQPVAQDRRAQVLDLVPAHDPRFAARDVRLLGKSQRCRVRQRRVLDPAQVDEVRGMPEVVDVGLEHLDFMEERHSPSLRRLCVRRVPLLARLALRLGGELLAVLVADVAEPRAARHVLAAFDPAVHVEPAPAATAAGAGNTGRLLVFLGAFGEDPLLLPDGNAPCMLTAEPAVAGTCAGVLATRKRAHADAGPPAAA